VCHQTVSLVARHLESEGIPTVVLGAAKDIVETVGIPRFAFSDVPLGNSAGLPHDVDSQQTALEFALRVLEMAPGPRTTVQTPIRWPDDPHTWKRDNMNLSGLDPEQAARARAEFQDQKRLAGLSSP
jgi:D-proline reductase (dithiol) PrdB